MGCWGVEGGGAGLAGSLMAYMTASIMCGSIVMVQVPSLVIESFGGLLVISGAPFFFVIFV